MNKTYILKGDVNRPGVVEIATGTTLRQIVDGVGGGMANGKKLKAIQIGGPSGGLLTEEQFDLPLDFKALAPFGVRRGDGVITVLDEDRCMVDAAYRFFKRTQIEFCGRCVSCREGTKRMLELMEHLHDCTVDDADAGLLLELGEIVSMTSFCALGKGSFSTLKTVMTEFSDELQAHLDGHCALCEADKREPMQPGGIPFDKKRIWIDPEKCRGCSRCARSCHAEAITGELKSPFTIDPSKCVKCYTCMELCAFDAIKEVSIDG